MRSFNIFFLNISRIFYFFHILEAAQTTEESLMDDDDELEEAMLNFDENADKKVSIDMSDDEELESFISNFDVENLEEKTNEK